MFGTTFYHNTLRKYIVLFGTLFNDIYVNRLDANEENIQTLKVPLTYSPKEKMLARLNADPSLNRPFAVTLPRMGFEIYNMAYDSSRKMNTVQKFVIKEDSVNKNLHKYQYNPVPYNVMFSLYIAVKNADDGTQILEQILPYFTPEWTSTVNLVPELGIALDIPIVLMNVAVEDYYEGGFEVRRAMIWTLTFMLKGYLFGPNKKQGIIKTATANLFAVPTANTFAEVKGVIPRDEYVTVRPGLDANGNPTSNSAATVELDSIDANDNYGFITTFRDGNG